MWVFHTIASSEEIYLIGVVLRSSFSYSDIIRNDWKIEKLTVYCSVKDNRNITPTKQRKSYGKMVGDCAYFS